MRKSGRCKKRALPAVFVWVDSRGFPYRCFSGRAFCRRECIAIDSRFFSDSGEVLHRWCLEGLGISLREWWDVHEPLAQGELLRVLPGWQAPMADISLVYAERTLLPRRLVLFMDFLEARWQAAPFGGAAGPEMSTQRRHVRSRGSPPAG